MIEGRARIEPMPRATARSAVASSRLDWERDSADWPHRECSRFVHAAAMRWHVQIMGEGPVLLLIHGTGAATHSWRHLAPLLAAHFKVVAIDLPGHGFSDPAPSSRDASLPGMARALGELLQTLDLRCATVVGHSAGGAIAMRLCLDGLIAPQSLVTINAALFPFRGMMTRFFSPMAKILAVNPLVPQFFSWGASDEKSVARLLRDTGSTLEPEGIALYTKLLRSPGHVGGALAMMANWELDHLVRDMPRLNVPTHLIVGIRDRAVSPEEAFVARDHIAGAKVTRLANLGHLAHEEDAAAIARIVVGDAARPADRTPTKLR